MSDLTIKTNNVPRPILRSCQLTAKELQEFDYLDADELEDQSFVRYHGWVYSMGDFMRAGAPEGWHGARGESFFSGVVIRLCEDDSEYTTLESATDTIGHDEILALVDSWAHVLSEENGL